MNKPLVFGSFLIAALGALAAAVWLAFSSPAPQPVPVHALNQVIRNIDDVQALLTFAEKTLSEATDGLQKAREILVSGDSANVGPGFRGSVADALRTLESAQFNGRWLYPKDGEALRFTVTLAPDTPASVVALSSRGFESSVTASLGDPALGRLQRLGALDAVLQTLTLERARVGAWTQRLEYAHRVNQILASGTSPSAQRRQLVQTVAAMEDRLYDLAIQASNGVYTDADRQCLQGEFSALVAELGRVQGQVGVVSVAAQLPHASVLTQGDAEDTMVRLSRLLKQREA